MKKLFFLCSPALIIGLLTSPLALCDEQRLYFPAKGEWQTQSPESLNINPQKLNEAVSFAQKNEYSGSRDLRIAILEGFKAEPFHEILGPTKKRGGPAGLVLKNGYIAAQWGDLQRVDMTFSVTKSYLSTLDISR